MDQVYTELQDTQRSGLTLPVAYRKAQLARLVQFLYEQESGLVDAMVKDFMIPMGASLEVWQTRGKAETALAAVEAWVRPTKIGSGWSLLHFLDRASVCYEPKGLALIVSAWNAPLALLIEPLIGAIAAGCCAVLKPSELAPNTADYLAETLPKYMDSAAYAVVQGGAEESRFLVESFKWDLIFFTGSERIGRLVYQAAALQLTPVVLELGGKSPAIVLADCGPQLQLAADRIVWGKLGKAGQLCVAPDYVMCESTVHDKFLGCVLNALQRFLGEQAHSPAVDRIVSGRSWDRLGELLEDCGGTTVYEGARDRKDLYFGPVVVSEPRLDSDLMRREVLPVVALAFHGGRYLGQSCPC